jgi:hypothetical protein
VNPAVPGSSAVEPVTPLFPTTVLRFLGAVHTQATTPWISYPDLYTAQCERSGTASWLQITRTHVPGDTRPAVRPMFGAGWGLHGTDVNIALTELVRLVGTQARAWLGAH